MTIVYLYAELMPYQIVVFKELVKTYSVEILAIHWDKKKLTPYKLPLSDSIKYISKSQFKNKKELLSFVLEHSPQMVYCSGWMDSMYNYVAKNMKAKGVSVVAGSDTQWTGGKQWLNIILSPFRQLKWFSHMWISGTYQYEYAKKLGFKNNQIIFNLLTADIDLYRKYGNNNMLKPVPKTFVFIGRFHTIKGLNALVNAFKKFKEKDNNGWRLICIGNGDQKRLLENIPDVEIFDFMSQEEICSLSNKFGVFILPSKLEPWGLVIHEAVCLGLPLLISNKVGAIPTFLIEGYNGYSFNPYSINDLVEKMIQIANSSEEELYYMKKNSFSLSTRITPEMSAASLISIIKR